MPDQNQRDAPEPLRSLDSLFVPDQRNLWLAGRHHEDTEGCRQALDAFHATLADINLNEGAPVETREHFGLACNLCLYGWYHYRFGMPAKLYGYLALETAVRRKYEQFERRPSRNRSFSDLLKWASGAGLLKDGGFSHLFARDELTHKVRPLGRRYLDPDGTHYVEEVFASTFLRNALAHGSTLLLSPGDIACSLQIIADGINQLFPLEI